MAPEYQRPRVPRFPRNELPRTGAALYGWVQRTEENLPQRASGLYDHMVAWGRFQRLPDRWTDWPTVAVCAAVCEAEAYLADEFGFAPLTDWRNPDR